MRVLIVGDFFPGGRLSSLTTTSPQEVLGGFVDTVHAANLAVLNLETPLCEPLQAIDKTGPALYAAPESAAFIANAGFRLATLANNHIFDFGSQGLQETFSALHEYGLAYVGAGSNAVHAAEPYFAEWHGITVAILNFAENEWSTTRGHSPGANPLDALTNHKAIQEARRQANHVVVICHGGHEMHTLPSVRMKELFRFYVEAGASAVINHHTHCVSGYEVHQRAPIFYSLGNFLFDNPQQRSGPWTQGMAVELNLTETSLDYQIHLFDQCTDTSLFRLCDYELKHRRLRDIDALNKVISDDEMLASSFTEFAESQTQRYLRYFEPAHYRLLQAAQNRGLAPSLLSKKKRRLLLNLIRCEAHREVIIEMLERDVGNSR